VGPYGEAKIAAEALCGEFRRKGLCTSIPATQELRRAERLGVFEMLYEWAYTGHNFPVLGDGNNRYQLLDVEDVCQAIELCATAVRERVDDVFNVGAREFGTMRENVQAVLDRAGHGGHVVSPASCAGNRELRLLAALHLSPLYPWIYDTAAKESFVSSSGSSSSSGSGRGTRARRPGPHYDWYVAAPR